MENQMIINKGSGIVECRICGLMFMPEVEDDRERHEVDHRRIICGAMPYDVREVLKRAGWEAVEGGSERVRETGKRAVVFGWWMRALWNGIPENDCDQFMAAHFLLVDALIANNQAEIKKAHRAVKRWRKYGG